MIDMLCTTLVLVAVMRLVGPVILEPLVVVVVIVAARIFVLGTSYLVGHRP